MAHECSRQLFLYIYVFVRLTYNSKHLENPWELILSLGSLPILRMCLPHTRRDFLMAIEDPLFLSSSQKDTRFPNTPSERSRG